MVLDINMMSFSFDSHPQRLSFALIIKTAKTKVVLFVPHLRIWKRIVYLFILSTFSFALQSNEIVTI